MTFVPSPYQQAVFNHFAANGPHSIIVKAVAGSGKSTTISKALDFLPPRATATLLAFNKDAAVELAAKVVPRWTKSVKTFHSAGFGAYRYWRIVKRDGARVFVAPRVSTVFRIEVAQ